jgi:hypothetical protein
MSDFIELKLDIKDFKRFLTEIAASGNAADGDTLEARITNRQKHAVVAEYGSGIYGEGPNAPRTPITAKKADALIIPVSTVYQNQISPAVMDEALANAERHPDILSKIKGKFPGIIGFIFRNSIKGMRPIRMVRDSLPKAQTVLESELATAITNKGASRSSMVAAVNKAAAVWLAEIVKRSPVLTSNLKTGWNLSKLAK